MNQIKQFTKMSILLSFSLILAGCGNGGAAIGYVSGKVTIPDKKNPAGLLIRFANGASGIGATAIVAEDGTYSLKHKGQKGVPIGTYKVSVTAYVPHMTDAEQSSFLAAPRDEQKKIENQRNAKKGLVPKKYHNLGTSGLSYEIISGSQTHNIVIKE